MTADELKRAEELLGGQEGPDAEDCERFTSRYGRSLIDIARLQPELVTALTDLEALLSKQAPEYAQSTVAANARAAIAKVAEQ